MPETAERKAAGSAEAQALGRLRAWGGGAWARVWRQCLLAIARVGRRGMGAGLAAVPAGDCARGAPGHGRGLGGSAYWRLRARGERHAMLGRKHKERAATETTAQMRGHCGKHKPAHGIERKEGRHGRLRAEAAWHEREFGGSTCWRLRARGGSTGTQCQGRQRKERTATETTAQMCGYCGRRKPAHG